MTNRSNQVDLVPADAQLAATLIPMARRIFTDTFAHLYDRPAFETFCDAVYAPDGPMARDLADPGIQWRVAMADAEPIGYAKVTPLRAPAPDAKANAWSCNRSTCCIHGMVRV